jgi:hypothetical protein
MRATPWLIGGPTALRLFLFVRTIQISHARRADKPTLLNNAAMQSGDIIDESGESKGVAAVAPCSASSTRLPNLKLPETKTMNRLKLTSPINTRTVCRNRTLSRRKILRVCEVNEHALGLIVFRAIRSGRRLL